MNIKWSGSFLIGGLIAFLVHLNSAFGEANSDNTRANKRDRATYELTADQQASSGNLI